MAILEYTESQFEDTTIERLRALGYGWCPTYYQPASTLDRNLKSVVLAAGQLRMHLAWPYPHPEGRMCRKEAY